MSKFYTNVNRLGGAILARGYKNGVRYRDKKYFKPTYFIPTKEQSEWTSLDGINIIPYTFDSTNDAKGFLNRYSDVSNFEIYGNENYVTQYIYEEFPEFINFDRDIINVTTIDIEVASDEGFPEPATADYPIITITLKNNVDNIYYTWGMGDYTPSSDKVVYTKCQDEHELLMLFITHWHSEKTCPDIVTGWNTTFFDIPYLVRRITKVLGENKAKQMSPWENIRERNVFINNREQVAYEITGIQQMDYLDLFKKFDYMYGPQESYRLDHIAHVVLNDRKLSYEEHGSLHSLYKHDFQKFVDYNIKDVEIVDRLEDKLNLITLAITMAYKAGVNFSDTFGTTSIWESIIYRDLMQRNIAPPLKKSKVKHPYPGAYVKEPKPGMYNWVVSFDLASLYPNIIVQWNMSPETIYDEMNSNVSVEKCLDKTPYGKPECVSVSPNGVMFKTNNVGTLPRIIKRYYADRKIAKKKMMEAEKVQQQEGNSYDIEKEITRFHNEQMSIKILMNSLYGALGNKHFLYFDQRIAEAITYSGKLAILWAEKAMNQSMADVMEKKGDYVIAIDTDSVVGDTIIEVNGTKVPIAEFYDAIDGVYLREDHTNEDFVKKVDGFTTPSIDKFGNLEYKQVKYVMKHKVKKKMYKIRNSSGDSVIVTEDHSIIVQCKSTLKIMSIKPENLDPKHQNIINIKAMDTDKRDNPHENNQKFIGQGV